MKSKNVPPADRPWWRDYFSRFYGEVYRRLLDQDLPTREEAITLARIFDGAEKPVFDIGCGYGRVLKPLASKKIPVHGIDFSLPLLQMIPEKLQSRCLCADMRSLPLEDSSAAGAYLLFNTFGYFDEEGNQQVLNELARVIEPGGKLMMDLPARSGMRQAIRNTPAATRMQEGLSMFETFRIDEKSKRLLGQGLWEFGNQSQEWRLEVRLYTPHEMEKLLRRAGFTGPIEFRPSEEMEELQTGGPGLEPTSPAWRRSSHMSLLAVR